MITYDVFQPLSVSPYPDMPFTATILKPDGSFQTITIESPSDFVRHGEAVAIKFDKPKPFVIRAAEIAKGINEDSVFARRILRKALAFLEGEKVDRQPSKHDWLDQKLDQLKIYEYNARSSIRAWFENPAQHTTAPLFNNEILTVKHLSYGRVIVCPAGHTLAYTKAQKIWYGMNDSSYYVNGCHSVGERHPNSAKIRHTSRYRFDVTPQRVKVGCQTIPRSAMQDLADREGWANKAPYPTY